MREYETYVRVCLDIVARACYRTGVRRTCVRSVVLEVAMSVSYAATSTVSFPARRSSKRPVTDAPLATVRDISTAPSARRRVEAQRADDPSWWWGPSPRSLCRWGQGPWDWPFSPQRTMGQQSLRRRLVGTPSGRSHSLFEASDRSRTLLRTLSASTTLTVLFSLDSASLCPFDSGGGWDSCDKGGLQRVPLKGALPFLS